MTNKNLTSDTRTSAELNDIIDRTNVELQHRDAELRIAKAKVTSLQAQLEQKTIENMELVAICDQLIGSK